MKIGAQIILFMGCIMYGQEKENLIDSFPIVKRVVSMDTLGKINHEGSSKIQVSDRKKIIRFASLAGMVFFGGLAWKIQQDADKQYVVYMKSSNPQLRKIAWDRTRDLDQTSGWFAVGSQLFTQLLIYSFVDD